MNNSIYPCLTIKGKTAEAAEFYINAFGEGKILNTSFYVVQIQLSGQRFMLLNDGPSSSPNPSISFMVISETPEETEQYWKKLIEGGKSLMPLDSYNWSAKYGWVQDKYGVSWQLYTGSRTDTPQKFTPTFMFTASHAGKAKEAVNYYTQLFPHSTIQGFLKYSEGEGENTNYIKHAQFDINQYILMAMDSSADHGFEFNDAISLVVECNTQKEIDTYWDELTTNGGKEVMCGWLTDKYGISWQIIPKVLGELVKEPERAQRVMGALMQMKKLVIADLENA
ncbi:3-demethylubiquinone-9 3-methyltransferase [Arcticibacter svalbardensis MN12-7]|uniref:3-demethylubiquinone-9 3-methyltransferase n=1 Tax=Arcticibacter svalbardensis MN12-7 TaxID=1150600 RepID=R9GNP8_9SPHI|nr:VOC family protein [Arcticibacter svalbardensis]EOR93348.1 3-demethylubiquinone-9 3-methyltransferase [Arcticibacter svalbardensis MN12-7]